MYKYKLSIIIAVYNVEGFIDYFFRSLLDEIDQSFQIIIVNDGSTDNSELKIKNFIKLVSENNLSVDVTYLYQKNRGVSATRNHGLQHALGEYVTFIDPDDTVVGGYKKIILDAIQSNKDLYTFNANRINENGCFLGEIKSFDSLSENKMKSVFSKGMWFLWLRVFRRNLFEVNPFADGERYEDLTLVSDIYFKTSSLAFIDKPIINYRQVSSSITQSPVDDDITTLKEFFHKTYKNIKIFDSRGDFDRGDLYYSLIISIFKAIMYVSIKKDGYYKSFLLCNNLFYSDLKNTPRENSLSIRDRLIIKFPIIYYAAFFIKKY